MLCGAALRRLFRAVPRREGLAERSTTCHPHAKKARAGPAPRLWQQPMAVAASRCSPCQRPRRVRTWPRHSGKWRPQCLRLRRCRLFREAATPVPQGLPRAEWILRRSSFSEPSRKRCAEHMLHDHARKTMLICSRLSAHGRRNRSRRAARPRLSRRACTAAAAASLCHRCSAPLLLRMRSGRRRRGQSNVGW